MSSDLESAIDSIAQAADCCPDENSPPMFAATPGGLTRGGAVREVLRGVLGTQGIGPVSFILLAKIAAAALKAIAEGKTVAEVIKAVVAALLNGSF